MTRNFFRCWLLSLLLGPTCALALEIGEIQVHSALNQLFDAEIPLPALTPEELDRVSVKLATPPMFSEFGLDRAPVLANLVFSLQYNAEGHVYVKVVSTKPIREPSLGLLLEFNWPRGKTIREFTVLLDPIQRLAKRPSDRTKVVLNPPEKVEEPAAATPPVAAISAAEPVEIATERQPPSQPAPEPAPAPAKIYKPGDTYGPIAPGEGLWAIALKVRPDPGITYEQMMQALFRANPQAFSKAGINGLKTKATLRIPTLQEIADYSGSAVARQLAEAEHPAVTPAPTVTETPAPATTPAPVETVMTKPPAIVSSAEPAKPAADSAKPAADSAKTVTEPAAPAPEPVATKGPEAPEAPSNASTQPDIAAVVTAAPSAPEAVTAPEPVKPPAESEPARPAAEPVVTASPPVPEPAATVSPSMPEAVTVPEPVKPVAEAESVKPMTEAVTTASPPAPEIATTPEPVKPTVEPVAATTPPTAPAAPVQSVIESITIASLPALELFTVPAPATPLTEPAATASSPAPETATAPAPATPLTEPAATASPAAPEIVTAPEPATPAPEPVVATTPSTTPEAPVQPVIEPAATALPPAPETVAAPESVTPVIEPAVPAAPPPAPESPTPEAPATPPKTSAALALYQGGDSYGPVAPNERLWDIAIKTQPDPSIGTDVMARALFKANPQAFSKPNMDSLKVGVTLRIPTLREIVDYTGSPAAKRLLEQQAATTSSPKADATALHTASAEPSAATPSSASAPAVPDTVTTPASTPEPAPPSPTPVEPLATPSVAGASTPGATPATTLYRGGDSYGPVAPNERLWDIAIKMQPDPSIGTDVMARALFKANPQAFSKPNMDSLKVGATLRIPTLKEIVGYTGSPAAKRLLEQQAVTTSTPKTATPTDAASPIPVDSPSIPPTTTETAPTP